MSHPGSQGGGIPPAPGSNPRGRQPTPEEDLGQVEKDIRAALAASEVIRLKAREAEEIRTKSADLRREVVAAEHTAVFRNHFLRQAKAQESGSWPALNQDRWDKELAADLLTAARKSVADEGKAVAADLGGVFTMDLVENYLAVGARNAAKAVNDATFRLVDEKVKSADGDKQAAVQAYKDMAEGRARVLGEDRATQLVGFAAVEAGKQLSL